MKIVKCKKCGNMIHEASRCYHCANTSFDPIQEKNVIHPNVKEEFRRIHILLQDKKFDDVIRLSEVLLEWMPRCAEVFWIRLLASHKCSTDMELICTGVVCHEDANYSNAVRYASPDEYKAYTDVSKRIEAIQGGLQKELVRFIHDRKVATRVTNMPLEIKKQMESKRKRLYDLWCDLEATEQKLYMKEMDCRLLSREYQDALQSAHSTASSIKSATYKSDQCTEKELHNYQAQLGATLRQSEQTRESLANMKAQHPWVKEFAELVQLREQQITAITVELNALKRYESDIRDVVSAFERIEENFHNVSRQIQNAQFREVKAFLEDTIFDRVLREAGIVR